MELASFSPDQPERIIRAAIRTPDGECWSMPTPARHHDLIRMLAGSGYKPEEVAEQGFRTNKRKFVDRVEGLAIATAAGQIKEKHGSPTRLFSEDMW